MDVTNMNNKKFHRLTKVGVIVGLILLLINGCQHRDAGESEIQGQENLSQKQSDALLELLPAFEQETMSKNESDGFHQRPNPPPPPRPGETIQSSFPPDTELQAAPASEAQPPKLTRYAPEGEVNTATLLSLSFSQPMVALGAHSDILDQAPPVSISPDVEGRWRWLDTHNIVFEPNTGRFPMATEFEIEVNKEMASTAGLTLEQSSAWSFSTPALSVERFHPGENQPVSRQPVIILIVNQSFDAEALLPLITLDVDGTQHAVQIASDEAIAADKNNAKAVIESLETENWVAITPAEPLPRGGIATITLASGVPAQEGPRLSTDAQSHTLNIAGPLEIDQARCNWNEEPCRPEASWNFTLTNPLADAWSKDQITIEPELPNAEIWQHGNNISISGSTQPETRYEVSLKAGTEDRFGQVLNEDLKVTFDVESYAPYLMTDHASVVVMPGGEPAELPVNSRNIESFEVELRRVEPQDWNSFSEYLTQGWQQQINDSDPIEKPGTLVERYTQSVSGERNTIVQTRVPLASALNDDQLGHVVVFISAPEQEADSPGAGPQRRRVQPQWIQVTHLGISAHTDREQTLVWATDLSTGLPREDVTIEYAETTATTDSQGIATLAHSDTDNKTEEGELLIVRKGSDSAFLNLGSSRNSWSYSQHGDYRYPVFTFDDRGIYRPGERGYVKGIVREFTSGPEGDIQWARDLTQVEWVLTDNRGNELVTGTETISQEGSFDITLDIPASAASGHAQLSYKMINGNDNVEHGHQYHSIQIQEFRRPEYEVSSQFYADSTSERLKEPYLAGDELSATVTAEYYAGGALPDARVNWNLSLHASHYSPPGHEDFIFGAWKPFWSYPGFREEETWSEAFTGTTDRNGEHRLDITSNADFSSLVYPHRLSAEASVTDVNRQSWGSSSELLVHPAAAYIGVRPESLFVQQGENIDLEVILVDIQGAELSKKERPKRELDALSSSVIAERMEWDDDEWKPTDKQQCQLAQHASLSECQFETDTSGQYRITAQVTDNEGPTSQTQMTIWVSGDSPIRPLGDAADVQEITLIPDQQSYAPGDTAYIQIDTPFSPAATLVTLRRQGIVKYEPLQLENGSHELAIPITDKMLPTLFLDVEAVGHADQPIQAKGRLELPISTENRQLNVDLALAAEQLKPGERAAVTIDVTTHNGEPVEGGELTLYAVDESVLALTGYELPDPLSSFYDYVNEGVVSVNLRDNLRLTPSDSTEPPTEEAIATGAMDMRASSARAKSEGPSSVRSDFSALAEFEATIALDAEGKARAEFDLPDNLTRYRIMAVVHREQQFGSAQTDFEVGLPLMVRPSLPRFLNLGDTVELPVVVQNTTDKPMTVELALRARNLELTDAQGRRITVPANDRREVRFTARPVSAGTAQVQVIAQSGQWQDSAELSLPVLTPATTEAFAQYGSLTEGTVFQPVKVPSSVYADFGGLELSTSSTQFQSLTDAFIYLLEYPYGCSEQIASRLMSISALGPMLEAFASDNLPPEEDIQSNVAKDIERLAELQNQDGGWGFWQRNESSQAYLSVHITQAILRAREAGYSVPDAMLDRARDFLANLENPLANQQSQTPEALSPRLRNSILAYSFYVQKLAGEIPANKALALFESAEGENLSIETLGWLLIVMEGGNGVEEAQQEIHRRLNNSIQETAATAQFVDDYPNGGHAILHGSRRTDAVALEALLHTQPDHDLIEKIARGLLNKRYQGHWGNTQENVFVLQALKAYFEQREAEEPNFTASAWLGELFLGEHQYQGRTTEQNAINVPMQHLLDGAKDPTLALQQQGSGRVYYRLGLRYAPDDLQLEAAAHGLSVERDYEAVNDPNDVQQRSDGSWDIRAGAAVRVKLTMTLPARRHYIALSDFLPAGLEPLNPELAVTANVDRSERRIGGNGATRYWQPHWYNHQQLRDERVDAFAQQVEPGTYEYEYLALATTPGEFIAPPAKAEEMYHPETFGRSGTLIVRVLEER